MIEDWKTPDEIPNCYNSTNDGNWSDILLVEISNSLGVDYEVGYCVEEHSTYSGTYYNWYTSSFYEIDEDKIRRWMYIPK